MAERIFNGRIRTSILLNQSCSLWNHFFCLGDGDNKKDRMPWKTFGLLQIRCKPHITSSKTSLNWGGGFYVSLAACR
jgi:hypothetical protein